MINRYNEAVSGLQVRHITDSYMVPHLTHLKNLPSDRICLQFTKEETHYLIVTFENDPEIGVKVELYLISSVQGKTNMQKLNLEDIANLTSVPTFDVAVKTEPDSEKMEVDTEKKRKWIGKYKRLQAAVACIDDRLSFLRICEELEKRGVRYEPLMTEPVVGGLVLKITSFADNPDISQIDCDDFFDNLVNCCLRLNAIRGIIWPFECTMKNCPLMPDFNSNLPTLNNGSDERRTITFVQDIGGPGPVSDNVTSNVIDRMSIYCNLYAVIKKFSHVYDCYFKQFCNIQAYTYHKIVIAYGDNRDQILMLSWKPSIKQFKINFGQYLPKNIANRETFLVKPDRTHKQWNPHVMVSNILNEKFNKDHDLSSLVYYVIHTHKILAVLYNFSKIKFRSLKSYTQIMGIDATFPIELQVFETPLDENTIHLVYGPVHLEFLLLQDNRCAIRDSSPKMSMAFGLEAFWKKYYGGELPIFKKPAPSTSTFGALGGPIDPQQDITAHSPYTMNLYSLQQQKNPSPINPLYQMAKSEPPSATHHDDDMNRACSSMSADHMPTSKEVLVVDAATLERAMAPSDDPFLMPPLEAYLFAISYIQRTGKALENYRKNPRPDHLPIPIKELHTGLSSLFIVVPGAHHPSLKSANIDPWTVKLTLYMCPQTFQLKAKLNFTGNSNTPSEVDIRIAEKYFEECIARLCNELALIAFLTLCRLDGPGVFESLVQVMKYQWEPDLQYHWKINLQLVVISNKDTATNSAQRKFESSIGLNEACTNALISICIRPQRLIGTEKCTEQKIFQLIYSVAGNELKVRNPSSDEEKALHEILIEQSKRSQQMNNECCIWPCIKSILERFHSSSIGSSMGTTSGGVSTSMIPISQSQQPSSVGMLNSIGPLSNAMSNPGSNQPR